MSGRSDIKMVSTNNIVLEVDHMKYVNYAGCNQKSYVLLPVEESHKGCKNQIDFLESSKRLYEFFVDPRYSKNCSFENDFHAN
jgi:hypothetical protein